jgi:hypothetical protein
MRVFRQVGEWTEDTSAQLRGAKGLFQLSARPQQLFRRLQHL